jgi:hypothetical protein
MKLHCVYNRYGGVFAALAASMTSGCARAPDGASAISQAIAAGQNDSSDPVSDTVVRLSGNVTCTGTFITPTAVLTAHHCIYGDSAGKPPIGFPFTVFVGATNGAWLHKYRVSSVSQTAVLSPPGTQTVGVAGSDVAVAWIDAQQPAGFDRAPAIGYMHIVRPDQIAPCADNESCPDANGGTYTPGFGMAGWAPQDSGAARQVAYASEFEHYPGLPDPGDGTFGGQYWSRDEDGAVHIDPGDSGGPLFVMKTAPDGQPYRDVLGVLSGTYQDLDEYAHWCDITRGTPADWLRWVMTDTTRTPKWHRAHPGYQWRDEVDYTTACQPNTDWDCDGWFNGNDNCPRTYNPDQLDTNDDGVGDACTPPPPPPPRLAISLMQPSVSVPAGGMSDVNVRSSGNVTGFVTFSANSVPAGLNFKFRQTSVVGEATDFEIVPDYRLPPQTVNAKIVATAGGVWTEQSLQIVVTKCQPYTCAQGWCGSVSDGCGGTLVCAPCQPPPPPPKTCPPNQHYCPDMGCVPKSTFCQ